MPNLLIATPHVVNTARKLIAEAERSHATRDKNAGGEAFRALAAQAIAHPEGLAVCQYLAHEADDYVYNGFGSWAGFVDTMQSMAKRSVERTRRAGRVLLLLDDDQQDFIDQLEQCSGQEQIEVLAVLAGAAARAEQRTILDMSGATTSARRPAPTYAPWQVNPLKIPKWRRQIIEFTRSQTALRKEYGDLLRGAFVLAPDPHTRPDDEKYPAWALCESEAQRLEHAKLYYIDDDLCEVAARKALRPRKTALHEHRVISGTGFMVFAQPIELDEGYAPVVAVSFSRFDPDEHGPWVSPAPGQKPTAHAAGEPVTIRQISFNTREQTWWWLTYYTQEPDQARHVVPMSWTTETVIGSGHEFTDEPEPGTNEHVTRFVFALFSLITQADLPTPKPVTRTSELVRKGAERRSDRRRGIEDDGRVRIVTVGRPAASQGARSAVPRVGGARGPLAYRQLVHEHDKAQCQNTHRHAELGDACVHEDITVLDYERGPADAPFRLSNTVYRPSPKDYP